MEYTLYTVAIGLMKGNDLYLSQRINTSNFSDLWQFAGGKLETNEQPLLGALRELKEETGLDLEMGRLLYLGSIVGDPTTKVCYTYYVKLSENESPKHTEDTMTDWKLMSFDEALKLNLMPGLKNVIEKLRK